MTITRRLGFAAAALAGLTAFAGLPYRHTKGRLDIARTIGAINDGSDHVPAPRLAAWIRDRKPGLRVIDVRLAKDFAAYAIPTAENIPLERLVETTFAPHETLVLYSDGGAHAAQAWILLQALGVHNAVFIPGGLADWDEEVLSPMLSPDADDAQKAAFRATSELSRYFGGQPLIGDSNAPVRTRSRRRGC
ncbi:MULTISPECIES: rhodanese-like domain-containing protein [Asticcacaulis]|uniref:rhodanese-like domain-containing protein n=1 Tax=Asticcacaulis TaxID=76890 RepID=UPI001AE7B8B1|nr:MULTISPECIES: rhodanese-like domain-containing protein [Asticcacaulis]MBP2160342.1 rhodanese-related sulfurtransferase [Asticcacaulis solisilvae]MDR6801355.1 rhodanese-related sulfurtransferase [Asticcacaulis sp. BE141]